MEMFIAATIIMLVLAVVLPREEPPQNLFVLIEDKDGYGVCHRVHHGSIATIFREGEEFSHADAAFIALARSAMWRSACGSSRGATRSKSTC